MWNGGHVVEGVTVQQKPKRRTASNDCEVGRDITAGRGRSRNSGIEHGQNKQEVNGSKKGTPDTHAIGEVQN